MSATDLQAILGHTFSDQALLAQALLHASAASDRTASNERMEFLGDRVLGLVIATELYRRFVDEEEGELAQRFAGLTCQDALVRVASSLGIEAFIQIGDADAETFRRSRASILADTLEALLGALYLDGGLGAAESFIMAQWSALIAEDLRPPKDAKTELQEWTQAHGHGLPHYKKIGQSGPDHAPHFTIRVSVEDHAPTEGEGPSKREAEQVAAAKFLQNLPKGALK